MSKYCVILLFSLLSVLSYGQNWQVIDSIAFRYIESKPDTALTLYKKHLPDVEKQYSAKSLPFLTFLSHLALAYNIKQKYKVCDSLYVLTIKEFKDAKLTDADIFTETVNNYFGSLFEQGKYLQAEKLYRQNIIHNTDSIPSKSLRSSVFNNLASLYDVLGKSEEAIFLYQKSLRLAEEISGTESEMYASTLNNLALCYKRAGNYPMAERAYEKAREIRSRVLGEKDIRYANTCNNLAALYSAQGKIQEAIEMYKKVEKIHLQNNREVSKEHAFVCNNLGAMYGRIRQYALAEEYHLRAKRIREQILGKNSQDYAQSCSNLANLYIARKELDKARKELTEAIETTQKNEGKNTAQYLRYLFNQVAVYMEEKNFYSAESLTVSIVSEAKKIYPEQHPQISSYKNTLAKIYRNQKKMDLADKLFIEVIDAKMAEVKQNFSNLSQSDKEQYFNRNLSEYLVDFYTHVSLRYKENPFLCQKSFDIINLTKGMIINSTQKIKQTLLNNSDTAVKNIFIKWQDLQKEIGKAASMTLSEQKKRNINTDSLIKLSNQYEKKLSDAASFFKDAKMNENISSLDIQSKLQANEAAIEIVRVNSENNPFYLVLILKKSSIVPEIVILSDAKELEREYLINYKRSLKHRIHDPYSYNVFWKPIQEKLQSIKRVYISNDGVYHHINLSALQNPATSAFVLSEVAIVYVTNTKNIVGNSIKTPRPDIGTQNYLIGNPAFEIEKNMYSLKPDTLRMFDHLPDLPGSEVEVKSIAKILPYSKVFTGKDATETEVRRIVSKAGILHIATHGYFNISKTNNSALDMLQAGILLAGVVDYDKKSEPDITTDDGKLTAYEIMNMELNNTELVVLSACETGLGVFNKNGIYGLQRALKIAGAQSMIISLWKVNDIAAQMLMIKFYQNWYQKKMSRHDAFLHAQQELRKEYPEPYYWGAFIMMQ